MSLTILIILSQIWKVNTIPVRSEKFGIKIPRKVGRTAQRARNSLHSCPNMVYCQGDLLDTVQKQRIYADSKTFVDMSQINDEKITLENFKKMMESTKNNPTKSDVIAFVNKNFEFISETVSQFKLVIRPNFYQSFDFLSFKKSFK